MLRTVEIFKPAVHVVKSDRNPDKTYFVTNYRPHRWTCTCPNWVWRSHNSDGYSKTYKCKHIKSIVEANAEGTLIR